MSALKPEKPDLIKGVRTTQTDEPRGSRAAEKQPRKTPSMRQLSRSVSTLFRKEKSSSSDQLPVETTAASDKDPATLATLSALDTLGQERKEKSARYLEDGAVREAAGQRIIERKINTLIDDAIEKNSTQLRELSTGAYSARLKRTFTGKLEKLQEREGFTRDQWRDKVLLKHGMPKVTEDELASFMSTPQARAVTERREMPAASSAMQPGRSRARDPFDTSDAALENFDSVQKQKTAARTAARKDATKEEEGVKAEAAEAARRGKKGDTPAS
jgi:hypothetical protein